MPRSRRKMTIEDRIADQDRGPGLIRSRGLSQPRTCATCACRDGYVEQYDDDKDQWFAICDSCNTPIKDPMSPAAPRRTWTHLGTRQMCKAEQLRVYREEARAHGRCTMCRARDARPGMLTCGLCSQRAYARKTANCG